MRAQEDAWSLLRQLPLCELGHWLITALSIRSRGYSTAAIFDLGILHGPMTRVPKTAPKPLEAGPIPGAPCAPRCLPLVLQKQVKAAKAARRLVRVAGVHKPRRATRGATVTLTTAHPLVLTGTKLDVLTAYEGEAGLLDEDGPSRVLDGLKGHAARLTNTADGATRRAATVVDRTSLARTGVPPPVAIRVGIATASASIAATMREGAATVGAPTRRVALALVRVAPTTTRARTPAGDDAATRSTRPLP